MTNSLPITVSLSGTDATALGYLYNPLGSKAVVSSITIVPAVSVSTHAANYITLTVKKGATTIATYTTNSSGGAAMTAGTPITMTISGTGLSLELAAGGVFEVAVAKAGTGPAYGFDVVAVLADTRL